MVVEKTGLVVVGNGPTGLLLATELALAGVDVMVLEKLAERSGQSTALNLQPLSAELFQPRGLLDGAHQRALAILARLHTSLDYGRLPTGHPYQVGIPQGEVGEVLQERLAGYGIRVRYGHELLDFTQDDAGATATLHGLDGDERKLRAAYLVGCDGDRSAVARCSGSASPAPTRKLTASWPKWCSARAGRPLGQQSAAHRPRRPADRGFPFVDAGPSLV